jgi:outer membrane protein assembly factor BamB
VFRALLLALAAAVAPTPAQKLGLPPVAAGPVPGYVMIADRNNNRIILVSPAKKVIWRIDGLHDPDDAFFTPGYKAISTNEEYNQTMALIGTRSHRIEWSYGHADVRGSSPGYLSNPDDAYLLPNGLVQVADIVNCRVLWVNRAKHIVRSIGHAGDCAHDPPYSLSSPNGDTPLPDGGVLVTEIGGWIDRISSSGKVLYTVRTPTTYPSDAQLLPDGNILVAGFNTPGRIDVLTPTGRIVWTYARAGGPGGLDRPSIAVALANGTIAATDDWHHRVVLIDRRTKRIVWEYGHLGRAGSAPGYLDKPDGLQLVG